MLNFVKTRDHSTVVWLTFGHLQLLAFLPLINVPIPAQVNEISKSLASYLRFDIFTMGNRSLMTDLAEYIFDF